MEALLDQMLTLTAAEITELKTRLSTKWGVSANVVSVPSITNAPVEMKAEPTEFAVSIASFDPTKKMSIIKMIRELTGAGLMDAKNITEGTLPHELKTGLTKDQVDEVKAKIEAAGGVAKIDAV